LKGGNGDSYSSTDEDDFDEEKENEDLIENWEEDEEVEDGLGEIRMGFVDILYSLKKKCSKYHVEWEQNRMLKKLNDRIWKIGLRWWEWMIQILKIGEDF
jgi:hypothetical protein